MSWLAIYLTILFFFYLLLNSIQDIFYGAKSLLTRKFRKDKNNTFIHFTPNNRWVRRQRPFFAHITVQGPDEETGKSVPSDIVLILDNSGSMAGEPFRQAQKGAIQFISSTNLNLDGVYIGIVSFNDCGRVQIELNSHRKLVYNAVNSIPLPGGGTSILEGLKFGSQLLENSNRKENASIQRCLVLLTDGSDSEPALTLEFSNKIRQQNIKIFSIGFGQANIEFLKQLTGTTSEEMTYYTNDARKLPSILENIRKDIAGPTSVGYSSVELSKEFSYLSTEGEYALVNDVPLEWSMPELGLKPVSFQMKIFPLPCVGKYYLNPKGSLLRYIPYNQKTEKIFANLQKEHVFICPFNPPWLWHFFLVPWWAEKLFEKFFCRAKEEKTHVQSAQRPLQHPLMGDLPKEKPPRQDNWYPTLFVGLGGSGTATALRLASYLADANAGKLPKEFRYLLIDTEDISSVPLHFGSIVELGSHIVTIGQDLYPKHVEIKSNPQLCPWYLVSLNDGLEKELFDSRKGTSRNRALGRLALHLHLENADNTLKKKLIEQIAWLKNETQQTNNSAQIWVCSSAIGGTGSAIISDITHLLLNLLENLGLPDQTIRWAIPEVPVLKNSVDTQESQTLYGNVNAFLLELERLKSIASFAPKLLVYPHSQTLKIKRFTEAEFFISNQDNSTAIGTYTSTAAFVLGHMFKGDGDDIYKQEYKNIISDLKISQGHSIVNVNVASVHCPVSLWGQQIQAQAILDLLKELIGIESNPYGRFQIVPIEEEKLTLIESLYDINLSEKETLMSPCPLLFNLIPGLSSDQNMASTNRTLLHVLRGLPNEYTKDLLVNQKVRATYRIAEWVSNLLNQASNPCLANALASVQWAKFYLRTAWENLRSISIDHLPLEEKIYYTKSRLQMLSDLLQSYSDIFKTFENCLENWIHVLSEGYPLNYPGLPQNKIPVIGTARKYQRRLEIIQTRFRDYNINPVDDYIKRLPAKNWGSLDSSKKQLLKNAIQWEISWDKDNLSPQPLQLKIQLMKDLSNDDPIQFKTMIIADPIIAQEILEDSLHELIESVQLSSAPKEMPIDEAKSVITPKDTHTWTVAIDPQFNPLCLQDSSRIRWSEGYSNSFRESSLYKKYLESKQKENEYAIYRGVRRHVHLEDIVASAFQRVLSEQNFVQKPMHPLIAAMLTEMHRLQYMIYCLLRNELQNVTESGSFQTVWKLDENLPWIRSSIAIAHGNEQYLLAIAKFVIEGKSLQNQDIVLDPTWQPLNTDKENLKNYIDEGIKNDLLTGFEILLQAMLFFGGMIPDHQQWSVHFFREVTSK